MVLNHDVEIKASITVTVTFNTIGFGFLMECHRLLLRMTHTYKHQQTSKEREIPQLKRKIFH